MGVTLVSMKFTLVLDCHHQEFYFITGLSLVLNEKLSVAF